MKRVFSLCAVFLGILTTRAGAYIDTPQLLKSIDPKALEAAK